jgi:hypothetical protein
MYSDFVCCCVYDTHSDITRVCTVKPLSIVPACTVFMQVLFFMILSETMDKGLTVSVCMSESVYLCFSVSVSLRERV